VIAMPELTPTIITVLSFGAVAAAVFVFGQYLAAQGHIQRRLPAPIIDDGLAREEGRMRTMQGFIARHFSDGRFGIDSTLRGKLRRELLRAGYFRSDAINYYLFFRMTLPVVIPGAAYILVTLLVAAAPWYLKLVVVCVALALAIVGPDIYLDRRQKALAQRYREIFPDFLDLLVVCIDAGLSLEAAINRVTAQISKQSREFGLNLLLMASEMRAGRRTIDALESLSDRLMIEEAQSMVLVLRQSLELGSDVADTLRVLGEEMRDRRVLRAEENANKLPVKMTIPLALFIFPVILIVVMFPVAIRLLNLFAH
jgi:tight adherence protein C